MKQPHYSRGMLRMLSIMAMAALFSTPLLAADMDLTDGITVDSTNDTVDITPGNDICEDAVGDCTLRAAIMEANAHAGPDTIYVPAGKFLLTITGVDELCENPAYYAGGTQCTGSGTDADPYQPVITADASKGDLDITDDTTIIGSGPTQTIVEWADPVATAPSGDDDPYTGDRIFHIQTTTASINSVSLFGMTLVGGQVGLVPTTAATVATPNAYDINIVDATPGSVDIWQFRRMGGAISVGTGYAVTEYIETVHGPGDGTGSGSGMGGGGRSDNAGPFPGGKPGEDSALTIGAVTLNNVVIVGNWSGADGGGLFSAVPLTMINSVIANNIGGANGGGMYNDAEASMTNVTLGAVKDTTLMTVLPIPGIDQPNHGENGGGLFDTGSHITTIVNSAINNNTAIGGAGIAGRSGVTLDIKNTTVSGNIASDVGGGITTNGEVLLTNASIVNNQATTDAPGGGAGLNSFGGGTYVMVNSLLAQNKIQGTAPRDSNCGCSGGTAACPVGRMVSTGYNLEDVNTCGFILPVDIWNTSPRIAALAYNGGKSETHALQADSPAIDAGSSEVCGALIAAVGNTDQRGTGYARVVDGDEDGAAVCDIGAFEYVPPTAPASSSSGCVYNPDAGFDPLMPGMLLLSLIYLGWSRRRTCKTP